MRIVVLTGVSGSGKTTALRALEDSGFYAIDNLPIRLLDQLVDVFGSQFEQLALVVDARSSTLPPGPERQRDFAAVPAVLAELRAAGHDVELVYFNASVEALERRYSETRRRHPLSTDGTVRGGIEAEQRMLEPLQQMATATLDTSEMTVHDLRQTVQNGFGVDIRGRKLSATLVSFGYKHGVPQEADMIFDVRFLLNPYFVPELRDLSGLDDSVATYVWDLPECRLFLDKAEDLLDFLIPQYEKEGKVYLTVAVGCTGGRHRSVSIVRKLAWWMESRGVGVVVRHRDLAR